jgi:hypothetical protein
MNDTRIGMMELSLVSESKKSCVGEYDLITVVVAAMVA